MGAAERLPMIGPVTEARIRSAFAEADVMTAAAACKVIGCDPKTLREMTNAGIIRAVRVGPERRAGTPRVTSAPI